MPSAALSALETLAQRATTETASSPFAPEQLDLIVQACRADVCAVYEAGAAHPDGRLHAASQAGAAPQAPPLLSALLSPGVRAATLIGESDGATRYFAAARLLDGSDETRHALLIGRADGGPFGPDLLIVLQAAAATLAAAHAQRLVRSALAESEARAHALLDAVVDAIITIDARGIIIAFNHAAERTFGYSEADVLGKPIHTLMPEPYHSAHDGYLRAYHETGRKRIIGTGREVTGLRSDGSVFPMYLGVSEVRLASGTVFTGIARDLTQQRRLELEVLRISDEERRRIGQDLHDGLGQMLTGIGLLAEGAARKLERHAHGQAGAVREIAELIREADQFARGLARGLVPVDMEQGGLRGALTRLAQNAERLFGVACTLSYPPAGAEEHDLLGRPEQSIHLYRIAQEAVSNAAQHGQAGHIALSLVADARLFRLTIEDDGTGLPPEASANVLSPHADSGAESDAPLRGMGLRIMHYRARILGATLSIAGGKAGGTRVSCIVRRDGTSLTPRSANPRPH
jgi:PAS domain S-box-containing protein